MKREIINSGLSVEPNPDRYAEVNPTHHSFRVFLQKDGWAISAIPYPDWKERQERQMKKMGM